MMDYEKRKKSRMKIDASIRYYRLIDVDWLISIDSLISTDLMIYVNYNHPTY